MECKQSRSKITLTCEEVFLKSWVSSTVSLAVTAHLYPLEQAFICCGLVDKCVIVFCTFTGSSKFLVFSGGPSPAYDLT